MMSAISGISVISAPVTYGKLNGNVSKTKHISCTQTLLPNPHLESRKLLRPQAGSCAPRIKEKRGICRFSQPFSQRRHLVAEEEEEKEDNALALA